MKTQLPYDIEAEQLVLGGIIFDPENIALVADILKPDDFHLEKHRLIYGAMLGLYQQDEPADYITLCDDLERTGKLEEAGGASYISLLINHVPIDNDVDRYRLIVHQKSTEIRRHLMSQTKQQLIERINNDFVYHAPFGDQVERYASLREAGRDLAIKIVQETPVSREQSLALTLLEQAVFYANAAIARNEKPE